MTKQSNETRRADRQCQYTFTVFTPTYNRAFTLHRVYESLKAQTVRDFEWLVIDEGSEDNTRDLVAQWQKEADFPIRYICQQGGQHVAHNLAVREARGELFLQFDSDDECVPYALERFRYHWDSISEGQRGQFASIIALCVDQDGTLVGDKFPQDVTDSNLIEIRYKYKVGGQKWGFFRTDILRQFPFPVIEGYRHYVPHGIIHDAISQRFKTRFINEPLHKYWIHEIGRFDEVNSPHPPSKHAAGLALWHQFVLNRNISWFRYAPGDFFRSAVHYARFSLHAGRGALAQGKQLDNALAKLLWATMSPIGFVLYWKDPKGTPS